MTNNTLSQDEIDALLTQGGGSGGGAGSGLTAAECQQLAAFYGKAVDAIATVLKRKFTVRQTQENYNNEVGVPLTIIGSNTGSRNPLKWCVIFLKAIIR